jgi:hypothetical protein
MILVFERKKQPLNQLSKHLILHQSILSFQHVYLTQSINVIYGFLLKSDCPWHGFTDDGGWSILFEKWVIAKKVNQASKEGFA